jgi:hypothetical protein
MADICGNKDEMTSIMGSIQIDGIARSQLLMLRSFGIPLLDCMRVAKQMQLIVEKDNEYIPSQIDEDPEPA